MNDKNQNTPPETPQADAKEEDSATVAAFKKCMEQLAGDDGRIRKLGFEKSDTQVSAADTLSVDLCINKISKLDGRRSH